MEERKRTIFVVIIALVLMIALLYSFGPSLFSRVPQLELANPNATATAEPGPGPFGIGPPECGPCGAAILFPSLLFLWFVEVTAA